MVNKSTLRSYQITIQFRGSTVNELISLLADLSEEIDLDDITVEETDGN